MRKTTNYGLVLYDLEDKMSITAEENSLNANMEIIDNKLKDLENGKPSGDSTNINNEILEFSKTGIPKIFNLEIGYLDAQAIESDNNKYYRSNFMKIDNSFKYNVLINNTTNVQQTFCYWFFDENKNLIGTRITVPVSGNTQKKLTITPPKETRYARILITAGLKDCLVRVYTNETIVHPTKQELRKATYGNPRSLDMLEYFGANKKVVFVGDSFTQGSGSSEFLSYNTTDSNGTEVSIIGNGYDYGIMHDLTNYETGIKLYASGTKVWHEAIDGNGFSHRLKNYLENKFGCSVKNYGISGITSGTLWSETMNSENSDLVSEGSSIINIFDSQEDWKTGDISNTGTEMDSTTSIRTINHIDLTSYSGDVVVSTSDTTVPFKIHYYNDNNEHVSVSNWMRTPLTLDKTIGTKVIVKALTPDVTNHVKITITAEDIGNIRVIKGLTNGFDTVFLTIGGNDRGFEDRVSSSTGETVTGKEQHRYNLRQLVEYILGQGKKLILMSMTPCADDPDKNVPMWDIDEVIGEVAEEYNVPFVSNYKGLLEYCDTTGIDINTLRKNDGIHPNDEGYAIVESLICEGLGINEVDKNYVDNRIKELENKIIELENLLNQNT